MKSDVPEFLGYAAVGGEWKPDFPSQVAAWCRGLAGDTGAEIVITITRSEDTKSRRQEKGFHAMVSPWARAKGWDLDTLKQWLLARVFGTHLFTDPTTGEVFQILAEPHTSKLTKRQYSELIERSIDIAAEDGVILIAPDEWRRMKEQERKQAARKARAA